MSLSLPYRKNRRYLTGIDWIIGGLHKSAFKSTGVGSFSQAILEIDGRVADAVIRRSLDQISARLPILHGRIARDVPNLCPFWKIPKPGEYEPIPLQVFDLPADAEDEARRKLEDHVNSPFADESQHLRLMLVRISDAKSRLGLVFDHRLLDATGSEAFLRLIDETAQGNLEPIALQMKLTEPAHLDNWIKRLMFGRTLNKLLYKLNETDVCALSLPPKGLAKRVYFVHESLTREETEHFNEISNTEIGLPIILPSASARATSAMRDVFPQTPLAGEQYLLFTSANGRPPGDPWETFFFNQFSFLMFTMPKDAPADMSVLAGGMRDQFFAQMKDNIPFAMKEAAALWRILPPWAVAALTRFLFKGRMCSIYFACVKDAGYPGDTFLGLPATNLTHTPLAFSPPGLNLCMTFFGGRFNLVLSYLDGAMTHEQAGEMMLRFKQSLTGN